MSEVPAAAFDPRELRRAFGLFATGVTVITAVGPDQEPVGITANSLASVSLDPPLLLWCIANKSSNLPAFIPGRAFAVHVLAESQRDMALHFAKSGRTKFEVDSSWRLKPYPPRIAGALARFDCAVESVLSAGDHSIVLGRIANFESGQVAPLLFHGSQFGRFEGISTAPQPYPLGPDDWF